MKLRNPLALLTLGLMTVYGAAPAFAQDAKPGGNLFIYNWSDYIAEDTIAQFEAETGIKVTYDVFDSNEVLEAKLLAGSTGYDLVVPSLSFLGRQIVAGAFQPIDRSKLSNYGNLDAELMARIADTDPGNKFSVPYLWGTTGIGYNVGKIAEIFGEDFEVNSWSLVLDPANASKLAGCGFSMLDAASEMIPVALHYIGEDPNSFDPAVIAKAQDAMLVVRPHVTYFHSSQYINDLANGDTCVAVGWSGDVFQAADRAEEAEQGVEVDYVIPDEGAPMWFDMLAIPADARNPENAHLFIDFLLRPEVMAEITDYVAFANAVPASLEIMDEEVRDNPAIYPPEEVMEKLYTLKVLPREVDRVYTRLWTTVRTGR
ncbi:MAG: polyamine ABC transporter substrate-binding protein [Gammaproteobacteria bacterium]